MELASILFFTLAAPSFAETKVSCKTAKDCYVTTVDRGCCGSTLDFTTKPGPMPKSLPIMREECKYMDMDCPTRIDIPYARAVFCENGFCKFDTEMKTALDCENGIGSKAYCERIVADLNRPKAPEVIPNDAEIADALTAQSDLRIREVAMKTGDASLCRKIQLPKARPQLGYEECVRQVAQQHQKVELCADLQIYKKPCLAGVKRGPITK